MFVQNSCVVILLIISRDTSCFSRTNTVLHEVLTLLRYLLCRKSVQNTSVLAQSLRTKNVMRSAEWVTKKFSTLSLLPKQCMYSGEP